MKEKMIALDENLELMLNSALRYALGRRSYITTDTCRYLEWLIDYYSTVGLCRLLDDLAAVEEMYSYSGIGGKDIDLPAFLDLRDAIENELKWRKENGGITQAEYRSITGALRNLNMTRALQKEQKGK